MNTYNQNYEFVKIDENFINGYLTPIAMLRDYTTHEVGFNYYFKKLQNNVSVKASLGEEFRKSFKYFMNHERKRYKTENEVDHLISNGLEFQEISNWQIALIDQIDSWTGTIVTNNIKEFERVPKLIIENWVQESNDI